jgi:hypothetical protein
MNLFRARNGNSTNQKFSGRVGFDRRTRSDLWSGISRGRQTQGFHRPAIFSGRLAAALLLFLSVVCPSLFANIEITLKNDFIEQFKDRATISVSFVSIRHIGSQTLHRKTLICTPRDGRMKWDCPWSLKL